MVDTTTTRSNADRSDQTRARILAAAIREFSADGLAGARTERIAEAAGVNKALLYYYFTSKQALYDAAFESVANRVVDMKVRLDACRPLVYRIGWLKERNKTAMMEASVAKLFVSEALVSSCMDALQIYGGYGYMDEYPIARMYKDARVARIYGGANDIMKLLIARTL